MSALSNRLNQLRQQSGSKLQTARQLVAEKKLADKIQLARASSRAAQNNLDDETLASMFGGTVYEPGLILIQQTLKLTEMHKVYDATFQQRDVQLETQVDVEQLLFVDTETSGLSSAAGTLVFLLGAGEVQGEMFQLEQMLLTRISAEPAMLQWFNEKMQGKSHLVSYNGKSFDVPLLATRYRINRMASDLLNKQHIDLLHWIRRLHQHAMPDCRLPSAEAYCLGFQRQDDLPGSEAPFVWQELIRFGKTQRVKPLLQHHAWDVVSLAGLLHYAEKALSDCKQDDVNYFLTAKYLLAQQQTEKAKALLEKGLQQLSHDALYLLSQIYRREQRWTQSVAIWQQLKSKNYLPAIESLAKYHEHKNKDFQQAISCTRQLIANDNDIRHLKRLNRLEKASRKYGRVVHAKQS